ncbi:hypothetical protein H8959_011746 [Pygathrix nigripes]
MEPELAAQKQPRPRRRSRRASGLSTEGVAGPSADTSGPELDGRYSLRRGSSFTFLTPGPNWDLTLKRKRREKDDDVVSLSSLDLKIPDAVYILTPNLHIQNETKILVLLTKVTWWWAPPPQRLLGCGPAPEPWGRCLLPAAHRSVCYTAGRGMGTWLPRAAELWEEKPVCLCLASLRR